MVVLILLLTITTPGTNLGSPEQILVITAAATPLNRVTTEELRRLYLKKTDTIQHNKVQPIQLKGQHPLRQQFDHLILGPRFNLDNYWIEQQFTAGESPPVSVSNEAFVLIFIKRNEGLIGYVNSNLMGEVKRLGLKVLAVLPGNSPMTN